MSPVDLTLEMEYLDVIVFILCQLIIRDPLGVYLRVVAEV